MSVCLSIPQHLPWPKAGAVNGLKLALRLLWAQPQTGFGKQRNLSAASQQNLEAGDALPKLPRSYHPLQGTPQLSQDRITGKQTG